MKKLFILALLLCCGCKKSGSSSTPGLTSTSDNITLYYKGKIVSEFTTNVTSTCSSNWFISRFGADNVNRHNIVIQFNTKDGKFGAFTQFPHSYNTNPPSSSCAQVELLDSSLSGIVYSSATCGPDARSNFHILSNTGNITQGYFSGYLFSGPKDSAAVDSGTFRITYQNK